MHKISIPKGAKAIILGLRYENHEAYIVGGCVRDSLLGKRAERLGHLHLCYTAGG